MNRDDDTPIMLFPEESDPPRYPDPPREPMEAMDYVFLLLLFVFSLAFFCGIGCGILWVMS